jgi:putative flippase GtrA
MTRKQHRSSKRQPNDHWLKRRIIQAVEYIVSGDVYFISGYAMFALLWSALGWSLFWAKISSSFFGWLVNYLLQRYWVFGKGIRKSKQVRVTRRYMLITLVDFLLDYLIVAGLRHEGISPYIGQFISAGFFTFWNYAWYRLWVFPSRKQRAVHGRA